MIQVSKRCRRSLVRGFLREFVKVKVPQLVFCEILKYHRKKPFEIRLIHLANKFRTKRINFKQKAEYRYNCQLSIINWEDDIRVNVYNRRMKVSEFIIHPQDLSLDYFTWNGKGNYQNRSCKNDNESYLTSWHKKCRSGKEGGYLRISIVGSIKEKGMFCKLFFSTETVFHLGYVEWTLEGNHWQDMLVSMEWTGKRAKMCSDFSWILWDD